MTILCDNSFKKYICYFKNLPVFKKIIFIFHLFVNFFKFNFTHKHIEILSTFEQFIVIKSQNTDTYRMFTPIGANGKLLTLNFHIDTGAATNSTNN